MTTKLYPPNIQGTIPAFCGTTLVVPFSLNRAVSKSEIAGFAMKIKTVQGSVLLGTFLQTDNVFFDIDTEMQVSFDVSSLALIVGQSYKVQLAFIDYNNNVGYYSTVGVVKYTSKPHIEIVGLQTGVINTHNYFYTGLYSQEGSGQDTSEKLYSSRFKLFNSNDILIKDSGEILHSASTDTNAYEAYETFSLNMDFEENTSYYLKFYITTSNGYTASTPKYRIMQKKSVAPNINGVITANLNFSDGYIDLYLIGSKDDEGNEKIASGSFIVSRCASNEESVWNQVCEFTLQAQTPSRFLWRDYTIEQGITYKYSIQQYNDYGLYSDRIESNKVYGDFEDAFLYDGERQLKIRYDPKISSFKTDVLESKTDTIGHKYPFIFRNGTVYYKEFPVSGLISYQMDDNKLFMDWSRQTGTEYALTDLSSDAIATERLFKLEVLDWLNNGKPKLFRSPTEGNYIVQLMNNSLSPTDSLGRMLHTFSATAYEIEDFSFEGLMNNNLVSIENVSTTQRKWATIELAGHSTSLDTLLSNARRYLNIGILLSFTEEQYNRILSYDYGLKDYFVIQSEVNSYSINPSATNQQLSAIGNILGSVINTSKTYSKSDYNKVLLSNSSLANCFIANEKSMSYTILPSSGIDIDELESIINSITYVTGTINLYPVYSIFATDMLPGTEIQLVTKTSTGIITETIVIGATGSYSAEFEEPVASVIIPQQVVNGEILTTGLQGSITYSYEARSSNIFDVVREIDLQDVPLQQWIGQQSKSYYSREQDQEVVATNLIEIIENEKISIIDIFILRFEKRPLQKLFVKSINSNVYYADMDCTTVINISDLEPYYVYQICNARFDYTYQNVLWEKDYIDSNFEHGYYVDSEGNYLKEGIVHESAIYEEIDGVMTMIQPDRYVDSDGNIIDRLDAYLYPVFTGYLIDGNLHKIYDKSSYSNIVRINNEEIDLTDIERYSLSNFDIEIDSIEFDNGVICEMSYQTSVASYNVEYEDDNVKSWKEAYTACLNKLQAHRLLMSLDGDMQNALTGLVEGTDGYEKIVAQYETLKQTYINTLGADYSEDNYISQENFENLEKAYLAESKELYENYIRQLTYALKNYEEANSVL